MGKSKEGQPRIRALTRINLTDFSNAFGLQSNPPLRWLANLVFAPLALSFARVVAEYDRWVGELGLATGSRQFLRRYTSRLEIFGQEQIPEFGPVVLVSNHPGIADTLVLFSSIPRPDLKIVALDRPFLRNLTHVSQHLIFVPDQTEGRLDVLREITRSLRAGSAILTFPAGEIEPDPASMPGARQALENWSESLAVFARAVPETCLVPCLVSGVVSPESLRHPLTRLRKNQKDRERLAAVLQIVLNVINRKAWPVSIQVRFGPPLQAGAYLAEGGPARIKAEITGQMELLIQDLEENRGRQDSQTAVDPGAGHQSG